MKSKYLFRMMEPEDWVRHYDEGTQVVNDFILPYGPAAKEVSDTVYHIGADVPYHEHRSGFETFFLPKGRVECLVRGQKFIMEAGDILHLPPFVGHGFKHLEEGNIWRELFQDIYMADGIEKKNFVNQSYPGKLQDDPVFLAHYRSGNDSIPREPGVPHVVKDRKDVYELRTPEFSHAVYKFDGVVMNLKVGRWECRGVKEVWHYSMEKGFAAEWDEPYKYYETFYIYKGRVRFQVMEEEFEAREDCLVHIPPFRKHCMTVLEDHTEIYDMNTETLMLSMLEDYESIKLHNPEKLDDQAFLKEFRQRYGCYITGAGKK
jgi:quercetin dioxygenase-like cupin family protein